MRRQAPGRSLAPIHTSHAPKSGADYSGLGLVCNRNKAARAGVRRTAAALARLGDGSASTVRTAPSKAKRNMSGRPDDVSMENGASDGT